MSIESWITFIVTASVILLIPGPTIIYVVMQSITHGRQSTLPLVSGVVCGDFLSISLSLLGLGALLALSAALFIFLKIVGAAYLIWLGVTMLRKNQISFESEFNNAPINRLELFRNVLAITSLNPKGIIFYTAFMPQFINPNSSITPQLVTLACTFLVLAFINALSYSLLANKIANYFNSIKRKKWLNFSGAISLISAGAITLTAKQV